MAAILIKERNLMQKAGIIGGAGFIGSHITNVFLDNGFEVKASTTDITNEEKYKHLMNLSHSDNLYVSELDVRDKEALKEFITDCDVVIHCGTPFILDVNDPLTQLFDPTIQGTRNFLDVIKDSPTIKKVVFVASVASYNTNFPMPPGDKSASDTFDEDDVPFTSIDSHPYAQAKFIANETVAEFIQNNRSIKFEISSVSPVMVAGKSLSNRQDSTSTGLQHLIKNKLAPNPFVKMLYDTDAAFAIVDVRDVAEATYRAAIRIGAHGKNYLLSSETYRVSDMNKMLNGKDPANKPLVIYKNDLAKRDLGVEFTPAINTLKDYSS